MNDQSSIFDVEIKITLPANVDAVVHVSEEIERIVGRKKWKESGWRMGLDIITVPSVEEEIAFKLRREIDFFKVVEFVKITEVKS